MSELLTSGAALLAVVLFLGLATWCFSHRRVDQSLAVLALYLGLLDSYLKLSTGSPAVALGRDVLVAAIAAGALARSLSTGKQLSIPPLGGLVLAFGAIVLVEVFNPHTRGFANGVAGVRQHLEFVPLFFLGYAFVRRERHIEKLVLILVVCAAIGGVVSYVQSTLTPEQFANWGPGYRERVLGTGEFAGAARVSYAGDNATASVRPFGLGSDLGGGAVTAALALPGLLALMLAGSARVRLASLPLAIGVALAIVTSGTRAGLITVFVSLVAFGLIAAASRNALRVVAGLAIGAVLVYAGFAYLGSNNNTAQRAKTIAPTRALSTFTDERGPSLLLIDDYATNFPLGIGAGAAGPAALAFESGNSDGQIFNTETEWNFLVLETGIVGLGVFVFLNLRLMGLALARIRKIESPPLRLHLAALAAPVFGLFAAGFAGPTTASVPPAPYLWLVAGVLSYWLVTAHHAARATTLDDLAGTLPQPSDVPRRRQQEARPAHAEGAAR